MHEGNTIAKYQNSRKKSPKLCAYIFSQQYKKCNSVSQAYSMPACIWFTYKYNKGKYLSP